MRIMEAALPLLLVVLLVAATRNTSESLKKERSEEETRQIFTKWKAEHGTTTISSRTEQEEEEEQRAYASFKGRLGDINRQWHDDGYSVFPWEMGRSEEETRQVFAEWKAQNGKAYGFIGEEEYRYAIFKETLRDMDWHNAGYAIGVHGYDRGVNVFSDITKEEFQKFCCGFVPVPGLPPN